MRVYISCHASEPANELAALLVAAGHTIASTWHTSTDPRPEPGDKEGWRRAADRNFQEIEECDGLVVVASPEHLDRSRCVPGGKFVEAGYAMRIENEDGDRPVWVATVGGVENGMLYASGVWHFTTGAGLIAHLNTKGK